MKVIFLDIDGVLNSDKYWESIKSYEKELTEMQREIDSECLNNLKKIVNITKAKIVITSSWKKTNRKYEEFKKYMIQNGISIYDKTPNSLQSSVNRGEEIRTWLEEHKGEVDNFIIIDDEIYPDFNELEERLVKTDFYKERGIEKKHVEKAINMLVRDREYDEER